MVERRWCVGLLLALMIGGGACAPAQSRVLECGEDFPATLSVTDLEARFGAAQVVTRPVPVGEGFEEEGAVVFPGSPEELQILWHDASGGRLPAFIRIHGERSAWATRDGITLGTDLATLERLNGRPFELLGFAWDYEGTVMSWAGGSLERAGQDGCQLDVRVRPADPVDQALYEQVLGSGSFSSAHPAMQALNPRVYQMWLSFERPQD